MGATAGLKAMRDVPARVRDWRDRVVGLALVVVVSTASTSAMACSPGPGDQYDDLRTPESLLIIAMVASFETSAGQGRFCYHGRYEPRETLHGKAPGVLEVSTCYAASQEEIERFAVPSQSDVENLGFAVGETVLVGATTRPPLPGMNVLVQNPGSFRYLTPSCWGFFHRNWGRLSEKDRSDWLDEFHRASQGEE